MTDDRSILCSFCFSGEPALYSLSMVRILRSQWNRSCHTVREEGGKLGPVSQHSSARDHTGGTLGDPRDRACLEEERLRAAGGWQASSAEATGLGAPVPVTLTYPGRWQRLRLRGRRWADSSDSDEQVRRARRLRRSSQGSHGDRRLVGTGRPDGKREVRHLWQKSGTGTHDQASDVCRLVKHSQEACESPADTDSGTCHIMGFSQVTAARMSDRVSRVKTRFVERKKEKKVLIVKSGDIGEKWQQERGRLRTSYNYIFVVI